MEPWQCVMLACSGVVAGVLGGLLGVGGAVVMIPAMSWILGDPRLHMHQYQAAAIIVVPLLILPSIRVHRRNGAIWTGLLYWMVPPAVAGVALGVFLSYRKMLSGGNTRYMSYLMGAFFLYVAGQNILRLLRPRQRDGLSREAVEALPGWRKGTVGTLMGVSAGLLSVGGGAVAVPAQQVILGVPLRAAIGTSAAAILFTGAVAAVLKNAFLGSNGSWQESLLLAALLAPSAMVGSYVGGHLTHRMPLRVVRLIFVALMLTTAGQMLWPLVVG